MKANLVMTDEITGATIKIPCEIDHLPTTSEVNVLTRYITTFQIEVDNGANTKSSCKTESSGHVN